MESRRSPPRLPDRPFHLERDQAVELERVLHGKFLGDRLDEAAHDHGGRLGLGDDQLFYLRSRGLSEAEATAMIVRGFIEPISKELPMEYALELNRLVSLQMEGAVG